MKRFNSGLSIWVMLFAFMSFASGQEVITGKVVDEDDGLPLIGVNIIIKGSNIGTVTDFDGNFSLNRPESGQSLLFSYTGYSTQEVVITNQSVVNISLKSGELLDEVVVVGYSAVREEDATGSIELLTADELNKGSIITADQMLNGKSKGVRIVSDGGSPDAAPNIRIRGGSSLSANNAPLIVIDDVPLSNNNPAGQANVFQIINPNDIESFSILKDASATAIYGSRASNGVIIITTKKGSSGKPQFNYSANVQTGELTETLDLMSGEDFADFIREKYPDHASSLGVEGTNYNTDWQDEIYQNSFSTDHNFSLSGKTGFLPYRASLGYSSYEGILKSTNLDRYSGSLGLSPSFWNGKLKLELNAKGIITKKDVEDIDGKQVREIANAISLNPTIPVFDPTNTQIFGGYYQSLDPNRLENGEIVKQGPSNAVAQLDQRQRDEDVDRFLGNIKASYAMPFLPQLRAVLNLGIDYSTSDILQVLDDNAIDAWNNNVSNPKFNGGRTFSEEQTKRDETLDAYFTYAKSLQGIISRVDAQAGYAYQDFEIDGTRFQTLINGDGDRVDGEDVRYVNKLNLQSFFGRVNFDVLDKFLFTLSYRRDGSSLFHPDNRWGDFPAAAVAWRLHEEDWIASSEVINSLKLRAGWGITGQQDITGSAGYYPFSALYLAGDPTVSYLFGDQFYITQRAQPFNENLTWERSTTFNIGIDFELFNQLLSGSIDAYTRKTEDLLAEVPQSEGSLINRFIANVGETESKGVELSLGLTPLRTETLTWELSGNISYNEVEVTNLNNVTQIPAGETGIGRGTGVNIGQYAVGQEGRNFWLFQQLYDEGGKPIADAFVDQNNDGIINDEDRVFIPYDPNWTFGFGTNVYFGKFDFSANFRGQLDGKIYDANLLNKGVAQSALPTNEVGVLYNLLDLWDAESNTWNGFENVISDDQALSDYFVKSASFLRFDNVSLGYLIENLFNEKSSLRVYGAVNNVALFTDYDGIDPENFHGVERSPYARPRTYTLGINLNF